MTIPVTQILPHAIGTVDGVVVVVSRVPSPVGMLSFPVKTNSFNTQKLLLGLLVEISSNVHYTTAQLIYTY